jgi:hypothetical protein
MIPVLIVMCALLVELAKGLSMNTAYLVWSVPGFLVLVLYAKWAGSRPNSVVSLART